MSSATAIRAGGAFVELFTKDGRLDAGLNRAQRRLQAFSRFATNIGRQVLSVTTIAAVPIASSVGVFASFSDQMLKVKAVTAGTEDEFRSLDETAKRLGRTTSFTASQVAAGMVELGRAGFSRAEIDRAIGGMLDLARATDTEIPEAAAIAGAALRQFGLDASEMDRVADVLTATANGSAQTLVDLGEALKPVGPIAREAGEPLESVAAAAAILANNGIKGSLAGNALARAYKNLSNVLVRDHLKELGVDAVDANNNLRPLATIIAELGEQTQSLGSADRLAIFEELFGRGQVAALKLADPSSNFAATFDMIAESQGRASQTAREMDSGIGGSFRSLLSALEGVAIALGEGIAPAVEDIADGLTGAAGVVSRFVEQNQGFVTSMVKGLLAVMAFGAGMLTAGLAARVLAGGIGVLRFVLLSPIRLFGIIFGLVMSLLNPMTWLIGLGLGLGVALLNGTGAGGRALQWLSSQFSKLQAESASVIEAIGAALANGDIKLGADILWTYLTLKWTQGTNHLQRIWQQFVGNVESVWEWAGARIAQMLTRIIAIAKEAAMWAADPTGLLTMSGVLPEPDYSFGQTEVDSIEQMRLRFQRQRAEELQRQSDMFGDEEQKIQDELDALIAQATAEGLEKAGKEGVNKGDPAGSLDESLNDFVNNFIDQLDLGLAAGQNRLREFSTASPASALEVGTAEAFKSIAAALSPRRTAEERMVGGIEDIVDGVDGMLQRQDRTNLLLDGLPDVAEGVI